MLESNVGISENANTNGPISPNTIRNTLDTIVRMYCSSFTMMEIRADKMLPVSFTTWPIFALTKPLTPPQRRLKKPGFSPPLERAVSAIDWAMAEL